MVNSGVEEAQHTWNGYCAYSACRSPDRTELVEDAAFRVIVADSPSEMERLLNARIAAGYGARMAAGYCWPWSDPQPDGSLVPDVQIDGWARPWNLKGDRAVGNAPPAALWAHDPRGFGQVGCVYTAQGFEYDWSGVIIGPDLVWRQGQFVTRREHNRDPDFRNRKRIADSDFDRLVRNVYKVLLTRGLIGTIIYSTDRETQDALRRLLPAGRPADLVWGTGSHPVEAAVSHRTLSGTGGQPD